MSLLLRLSVIIFTCTPFILNAQDTTKTTPWFFDDGGISKSRNTISIDLIGFVKNEYSLYWEHRYARAFSIELGAGIASKNYKFYFPIEPLSIDNLNFKANNPGLSLSAVQKITDLRRHYIQSLQVGVYHHRFTEVNITDCIIGGGFRVIIGNRATVEFSTGIGARFQHSNDGVSYVFSSTDKIALVAILNLKVGYQL